jgi:universal stress protein E
MNPIRCILVPIKDPSANPLPAVAKAARIAKACGAHLELFHAMKALVYANSPADERSFLDWHEAQRQQYLQRLERIAARLRLHDIPVSTAVEYDYPAYDAIIRRARVIKADLIVARRHTYSHTGAGSLHLTDWELLRHSPVPVLLVKRSRLYRHPTVLAAVDPCHAHSKPAQLDEAILNVATQLTQALRGKLHAVHAYGPVVLGSAAASVGAHVAARLEGIAAAQAKTEFQRLLEGRNIPPARRHLLGAWPAAAIDMTVKRMRADIAVMGALSRSGLKRLFIGNTAERLLDELPCDVLVVKPAQFKSAVPTRCNGLRIARTQ